MSPTHIRRSALGRARRLRRDMSPPERLLWQKLRALKPLGIHVRRQAPIGSYIADFAVHAQKLVIEVDGDHHGMAPQLKHDTARDRWLESQGYHIARYSARDVRSNIDSVVEDIGHKLGLS
ncbi:MAG: endonuclease domain-containing protein [Pseudomonadota bacterium]